MRATILVVGAAVLLAGCGAAANQGAAPANGPSTTPTEPSVTLPSLPPVSKNPTGVPAPPPGPTTVPAGAVLLPASQVDVSALPSYWPDRSVWSVNDGRSLVVSAMARDACAGVQGKVVEQSENTVRVMLSPMDAPQGGQPDGGSMCAQVLTPKKVTVDLKVPLGQRKVIVTEG